MPKKPYRSLSNLESENKELLSDLIGMVNGLIKEYKLEDKGYRLITNGGKYQNIKYLHFHLVSDE
jgi:diadenosine tetraphosphate (Ap4A) HIT family hydrolase